MADVINSAYDAIAQYTVGEILEAPELFEAAVMEQIEGEQAYKTLFSTFNTDAQVVPYGYDTAPELEDTVRPVPEFGEIPVSDPSDDKDEKFAKLRKYALGIRISDEQRLWNNNGEVQREIMARARTIRRFNASSALAALNEAPIADFAVDAPWDIADADIREDFGLVTDMILGATDDEGRQFGYEPNIFWANPVTINRVKRNKTIASDFIGDMASENPVFKRIGENPLLGGYLQVVPDMAVPVGEAYMAVEGITGFEAQNGAPHLTPFYEERGASGRGGADMTWRSDYVHYRALAVRAPKSIVKLTGLATD